MYFYFLLDCFPIIFFINNVIAKIIINDISKLIKSNCIKVEMPPFFDCGDIVKIFIKFIPKPICSTASPPEIVIVSGANLNNNEPIKFINSPIIVSINDIIVEKIIFFSFFLLSKFFYYCNSLKEKYQEFN